MRQFENVGRNDVTGDTLRSKAGDTAAFSEGHDKIDWSVKLHDDESSEAQPEAVRG